MKRRFGALSLAVAATLFFGQRAGASSHDVEAGLLRDDADAQDKCPAACSTQSEYWTGQWRTAAPEKTSSCHCALPLSSTSSSTRALQAPGSCSTRWRGVPRAASSPPPRRRNR
ncbi:mannan-binding protein [Cystobacter fuscus]